MNKTSSDKVLKYIETPRRVSSPVKIDVLLRERMKAFLAGRKVRR